MNQTLLPLLALVPGVVGGLVPTIYRRWRQRRCHHQTVAMDPSGRTLCLECLKVWR